MDRVLESALANRIQHAFEERGFRAVDPELGGRHRIAHLGECIDSQVQAASTSGKKVILLSYPDEAHHLGRKENQKDFQIRMRQFFDHYLKGAPAPVWMTDGVPQVKKGLDPTILATPTTKKTDK